MNECDSEVVVVMLCVWGYWIVGVEDECDVMFFNMCSVCDVVE